MTDPALERSLAERGWAVVDLPDPSPVARARDRLLARLRELLPGLPSLEAYHAAVDGGCHEETLFAAASDFWESDGGPAIIRANLDLVRGLAGPDLHVQRRPYLRCVRPGRPEDAAPLHRDTYYGASPYEISVLVPLVEMPAEAAVRAIPGSHLEPDSAYPYREMPGDAGLIGSPRHRLGYPYAPRLLDPALQARAVPVPVAFGQAMIFGLSLVHGGGINEGAATRFSTDIRIVDALAPVRLSRGVDSQYFVPLCASPISRAAQLYLAANEAGGAHATVT
jgi:hypothetical protein